MPLVPPRKPLQTVGTNMLWLLLLLLFISGVLPRFGGTLPLNWAAQAAFQLFCISHNAEVCAALFWQVEESALETDNHASV